MISRGNDQHDASLRDGMVTINAAYPLAIRAVRLQQPRLHTRLSIPTFNDPIAEPDGEPAMPKHGLRPAQFECNEGQQCKARSKRSGERCRNYACQGRETCRMHGGTSLRGQMHPNYKTGKHSKVMRKTLKNMGRLMRRPVRLLISFKSREILAIEKPELEDQVASVCFPDEQDYLSPQEKERLLRAARNNIDWQLRMMKQDQQAKQDQEATADV